MEKRKRDKHLLWGASDDNEFQTWVETNHPNVYNEWLDVFEIIDLYDYLEQQEYEILDEWLREE